VGWALAVAAMLAVVAVVFVARPFLRDPAPASDRLDELAPEARERLALAEERDRALAALKELEFDHRTGKVSDEDYRAQVGPLRRRAAEVLRALEGGRQGRRERVDERISPARVPVQERVMVTPNEPHPPYPPPDEGNPPEPAQVPEPYPPPDEGTPPVPAPDPGRTEGE
jgi:hypothetical protein